MDGFAPTGGMWEKGVFVYDDARAKSLARQASILDALDTVATESVQHDAHQALDKGQALERYWAQVWLNEGDNTVENGSLIYEGKGRDSYVTTGEYDGQSAIVKHGPLKAIRNELSILSAVDGVAVPRVYGYHEEGERGSLSIERLSGTSLKDHIKLNREWQSEPLDRVTACKITIGLARALEYIRKKGYLYRDLNLDHIFIDDSTDEMNVRLIDVESSERLNPGGIANSESSRGTWETMAPEEFRPGAELTEATLVYSTGVVLAQLLKGKNQFYVNLPDMSNDRLRFAAEYAHIAYSDPKIEGQLGKVVKKALAPNPKDRPQTLAEFIEMLEVA